MLFVVFYVFEELDLSPILGLYPHEIMGYIGISLLGGMYLTVILEILVQMLFEYCPNS